MDDEKPTLRPSLPPPEPQNAEPPTLTPKASEERAAVRRVLLSDDEEALRKSIERILKRAGFEVVSCADGNAAVDALMHTRFDVILADVHMPGTSGVDVLRIARAYDLDVPVLLMTGGPDLGTAMQAVDLGALQYLVKPVEPGELIRAVERAARLRGLARVKREARAEVEGAGALDDDESGMARAVDSAIETMNVALEPIASAHGKRTVGFEVRIRLAEPTFESRADLLAAAEKLGRVHDVGRRVRRLAAEALAKSSPDAMLFIDIHPLDLLDAELADQSGPLGPMAERVVLEVSEQASFEGVRDLATRASILRYLGFRFALDDCGASNVGLESFSRLEPEFVKLDAKLVRNVHKSATRKRLARAFATLCAELGATPIAEAVETADERDALCDAGYDLMQGAFFGKPTALKRVVSEPEIELNWEAESIGAPSSKRTETPTRRIDVTQARRAASR